MAGVCGAALLVGTACSTGATPADDPLNTVGSAPALASAVGVLAVGCGPAASAGSGVVLGAPGQVVTVAHTVAGATSITVVTSDGIEFDARVVSFDPDTDLAVLEATGLSAPPLAVGEVQLGAATLLVWSAGAGTAARHVDVTQRLAITIDDIYGSTSAQRSGFELTGDVVVGDSGGPVVSAEGEVFGIVYARSRSRAGAAFATDTDEIIAVLAAAGTEAVDNGTCV